ncbi:conserved hypothetical protein [Curtobacterium sp. 8I-2]|nr:conserved hypothetical protein [Curtobacterium sp. 8I-2]
MGHREGLRCLGTDRRDHPGGRGRSDQRRDRADGGRGTPAGGRPGRPDLVGRRDDRGGLAVGVARARRPADDRHPRRRRRARTRLGAHRHDRRCRRGPDPDRLSHVSPMCRRAGSLRRQHG